MIIKIRVDGPEDEEVWELSTENIENLNYVETCVDGKEYYIPLDDLSSALLAFDDRRKRHNGIGRENE